MRRNAKAAPYLIYKSLCPKSKDPEAFRSALKRLALKNMHTINIQRESRLPQTNYCYPRVFSDRGSLSVVSAT